jgi:hypothetical protein
VALSDQESRCVELACGYLSSTVGGNWTVESYPDELYPTDPTPEIIVTNGNVNVAIEVKRLTGDSIYQAYKESLLSNQTHLTPSCGGYYTLIPPIDFKLPLDINTRKQVRQEIERLAPTLQLGATGAVRVPRQGHIHLISESGPPYICCRHSVSFPKITKPLLDRITGRFMLIDEGLEHKFVTDEGRAAFSDAVVAACQRRLKGDASRFSWYEEWELRRIDGGEEEGDSEDGVWVVTCTEARDVRESVAECIYYVLEKAVRKFAVKRWAELHLLVLDNYMGDYRFVHEQLATEVAANLQLDDSRNVDFILIVDKDKVAQFYPIAEPS